MPDSASEKTPLLPQTNTDNAQENRLVNELGRPPCRKQDEISDLLTSAALPFSYGHPLHHHYVQSPALICGVQQAVHDDCSTAKTITFSLFASNTSIVSKKRPESSIDTIVAVVNALSLLKMLAMTALGPTLLLYMNDVEYTSSTDSTPYVAITSLSTSIPIASDIVLSYIASHMGIGRALALGTFFSAVGILAFICGRGNFITFFVGYGMFSVSNTLQAILLSILTRVVPDEEQTNVLAAHALVARIGALLGPLIWIAFQTFRGKIAVGGVIVDRFFLDYGFGFLILLVASVISWVMLHRIGDVDASEDENTGAHSTGAEATLGEGSHAVAMRYADGDEENVDLDVYTNGVFIYFCVIMFGVNLSTGSYMTSFQPVLVNEFHATDAKLGFVFELIAMFSVLPPFVVAVLSRHLEDLQIMAIGLAAKLIGMTLFLPLFGPVREWQVIVGFMLILNASVFFSTASVSLFTELLKGMNTRSILRLLAPGSTVGPAVAQIVFADSIAKTFGSNSFGILAIPAIVSLVLILFLPFWAQLSSKAEPSLSLVEETRNLRSALPG